MATIPSHTFSKFKRLQIRRMPFDLILSLPTVLSCEILSAWLFVSNLAKLDSAYCNHKKRPQFQSLCEQPELICSLAHCPRKHIGWMLTKRVKLCDFDVRLEVPEDVGMVYLKEFGRFIQTLTLSDATCEVLIKAAAEHCTNVSILELDQLRGASYELLGTFQSIDKLLVVFISFSDKEQISNTMCELPNLRTLIATPENGAPSTITKLVAQCPNLTHLWLDFCSLLPSEPTVTVVSKLKSLIMLNLGGLPIDDAALAQIVSNCKLITNLNLSKAEMVTDAGVFSAATALKLKCISLPCKYNITNKSVEYLHHCAGTLEKLNIVQTLECVNFPDKLTMSAVQTFLQKAVKCSYTWTAAIRTRNDLSNVCGIATTLQIPYYTTNALLVNIAQRCTLLRVLDIFYSTRLDNTSYTEGGLLDFVQHCPRLEKIIVSEHFKRGFRDLVLKHPRLFTCPEYGGEYLVVKNIDE